MADIRWATVFTKRYRSKGVTEAELRSFVSSLLSPLTSDDVAAIIASPAHAPIKVLTQRIL